ncbi:MAG: DMT family transporter [Rhodospirillales bacterium]|jgi:S-adenosylmethionine uptake transporter|nr:DMT family transporter [Rhodospirillales bacterium]MBT4041607.1 DMT family transporter [Rhodospirillales bacterium]MBT4627809.1 DMT family transporter [Rhodospirillales bacterium]MBT5352769.1 DMT family transporter [Rhodospirillales bacterium]MBT5520748.1 DMT family transporter [Rhodospirillales bacterium]
MSNENIADTPKPVAARKRVQEGMVLMIIAMLLMPGIDAIAKGVSGTISSGQVTWSRFFFQTVILIPFVLYYGGLGVGRKIWGHAARGVLIGGATLMFFTSLRVLPLADAIAIFFVEPFILTLLSVVLLGERVGWRRLAAISVGFCGAMIIVQPSYEIFGVSALYPLGAATLFAFYMVLTRWLAGTSSAVAMQFYTGVFGMLTLSAGLLVGKVNGIDTLSFVWPTAMEWALLGGLGFIGTFGHLMIIMAVRRVGAGLVAPFQYMEIISATILGYMFFGDFPDVVTWVGIVIIVASGLYVFYRERLLAEAEDDESLAPAP